MLTGLSSPKFDEAMASVCAIQEMFRRESTDVTMEEWTPSMFQEHTSFDVGNRYFTPRQHALQDRQIAFSASIDPDNILANAMGDEFVHTEDNQVEYYEARREGGKTKYISAMYSTLGQLMNSTIGILKSHLMQCVWETLQKHKYRLK